MKQDSKKQPSYRRLTGKKKTTMSVTEMRQLLGLGYTDSYWLLHKGRFETLVVNGHYRVVISSFETWYANQFTYKKVCGPPPGAEARAHTYSIAEAAQLIGICDDRVYVMINRGDFPAVTIDHRMRIEKDVFWSWYGSQKRYRTKEDRALDAEAEADSLSMPEMKALLGLSHRNVLYSLLSSKKYRGMFEYIYIGEQKRITKTSFLRWYNSQNHYHMVYASIEEAKQALHSLPNHTPEPEPEPEEPEMLRPTHPAKVSGNPDYYTPQQAAALLHKEPATILRKIRKGEISAIKVGTWYRIPKAALEQLIMEEENK